MAKGGEAHCRHTRIKLKYDFNHLEKAKTDFHNAMKHYYGPDILRLFASALVVLFHLSEMGGTEPSWPVGQAEAPLGWLYPISWMGWIGVQIFFVLSGFLIAASAQNSTVSIFLKKRAIRIFPALWISAAIALFARAIWGEPFFDLVPSFLKAVALSPKGPYIDGVVWTLVVEAAFYCVIAGIIAIAPRLGGLNRCLVWAAFAIGVSSTLFTSLYWIAAHATGMSIADALLSHMDRFVCDLLLLRQGMFFAIGILLFHIVEHRATGPIKLALAVFALAGCLQISITSDGLGNPLVPILIWASATVLTFASVKYSGRLFNSGWSRFTRQIGLLTYPLYLNHFILGQALVPFFALWLPNRFLLFPAVLAVLLLNAWFISWGPERWIQRWARSRLFSAESRERALAHAAQSATRQRSPSLTI